MLVPFSPFPGIFLTENAAIAAAIAAINEIYGSPIAVKTIAAAEPESRIIEIFLCSFRFMANGITSAEEEIPSIWAEIFPKVSSAESCFPEITERDLIEGVAVKAAIDNPVLGVGFSEPPVNPVRRFAVVDSGIKKSIISCLYKRGAAVTLLPPTSTAEDILGLQGIDALFLSNGPGDPALLHGAVKMAKGCIGKLPVQGICLGHQIITMALGGRTVKMKFGHHGSNHPVRDCLTGKTFVTAQNHGFMSDASSLPENVKLWFVNANDGSVEGLYENRLNVRSVQFHPEAAPGPEEGEAIFDTFMEYAK